MNLKLQLREEPEKGLNEPGGYPVWVPSGYSLARFIRPVSHPLMPSCLNASSPLFVFVTLCIAQRHLYSDAWSVLIKLC